MNYCYKKEGFYYLLLLTDLTYVNIIYTHTAAPIFPLSSFFIFIFHCLIKRVFCSAVVPCLVNSICKFLIN